MLGHFMRFLWEVVNNWAGYATGGLILATLGFRYAWKDKQIPSRVTLWLSPVFLVMALFKAWDEQYSKVIGQIASLESSTAMPVFAGDPFPIGKKASVYLVWHNYGPSDAVHGRHSAKPYVLSNDDAASQKKMIDDWKSRVESEFARSPGDPIFHANTDRQIPISTEETVTKDLHDYLLTGERQHLFLVSAVRFEDGAGKHEAHACLELRGLSGQGLNWQACRDYVTPIDIP